MRTPRYSQQQITAILQERSNGATIAEICRRHGISATTYYSWKSRAGGSCENLEREISNLRRENRRLLRLVSVAILDNAALKGCSGPGESSE